MDSTIFRRAHKALKQFATTEHVKGTIHQQEVEQLIVGLEHFANCVFRPTTPLMTDFEHAVLEALVRAFGADEIAGLALAIGETQAEQDEEEEDN